MNALAVGCSATFVLFSLVSRNGRPGGRRYSPSGVMLGNIWAVGLMEFGMGVWVAWEATNTDRNRCSEKWSGAQRAQWAAAAKEQCDFGIPFMVAVGTLMIAVL